MLTKRAIISVHDKSGADQFARGLVSLGYEIVSSGGTAAFLRVKGVDVVDVSEVTGFPEMLDGRVKTLHPRIHAGILARRDLPAHLGKLRQNSILPIDLVAVNLYPFEQTVARPGVTREEAIENIDIGGPSLIRAAAKNHAAVTVVTSPDQYRPVLDEIGEYGDTLPVTRERLAREAFELTARYDSAIGDYFRRLQPDGGNLPPVITAPLERAIGLRYGENPHQAAGFYLGPVGRPPFEQLHGKEISYNNILDLSAAWGLVREFKPPACAIIKHTNPCGCALGDSLAQAYALAEQGELPPGPISRYGGIVALNRPLDSEAALLMVAPGSFYEVIVAPGFEEGVKEIFAGRKGWGQNVRLVRMDRGQGESECLVRSAAGGFLVQRPDATVLDQGILQHVAGPAPSPESMESLTFAYQVVKHVKSNAIVIARGFQAVGVGAGQMNRLASVRLALKQAGDRSIGAVLASDGFFPFADNIEEAAAGGIAAVIQPGGSVKDAEVIKKAGELNVTMMLTGIRHFRH